MHSLTTSSMITFTRLKGVYLKCFVHLSTQNLLGSLKRVLLDNQLTKTAKSYKKRELLNWCSPAPAKTTCPIQDQGVQVSSETSLNLLTADKEKRKITE